MMRQFGITCNGAAVTAVDQIESVAGALDPAAPVEIRCPTMFPETSIECRDLLSALGFGAFTIEVRGYLFTAVHGFIPNMERWRRACGSNRVPARSTDGVQSADRTAVAIRVKDFGSEFRLVHPLLDDTLGVAADRWVLQAADIGNLLEGQRELEPFGIIINHENGKVRNVDTLLDFAKEDDRGVCFHGPTQLGIAAPSRGSLVLVSPDPRGDLFVFVGRIRRRHHR